MITKLKTFLCLLLAVLFLTACARPPNHLTTSLTEERGDSSNTLPVLQMGGAVKVHLPTSQKQLGEVLEEVAAQQGLGLEMRYTQSEDALQNLTELLQNEPPDIFWLGDESEAQHLAAHELLPRNIAADENSVVRAAADLVPPSTRLLDSHAVYGLPVGFYGEGYLVNRPLIAELLGAQSETALTHDLQKATLEQWDHLGAAVESYLEKPRKIAVKLGEGSYTMPAYPSENTRALKGVFAIPTAEAAGFFENTLSATYGAGFGSALDWYGATAEQKAQQLQTCLPAALDVFEVESKYMTHTDGAFERGENYAKTAPISGDEAQQLFVEGKALFLKGNSQTGLALEQANPHLKGALALVPAKVPINAAGADEKVQPIYQSYGMAAAGYLCISSDAVNGYGAQDLLLRLFTSQHGTALIQEKLHLLPFAVRYPTDSLNKQLAGALTGGDVYAIPIGKAALLRQQQSLGEWAENMLMKSETWSDEERSGFHSTAAHILAA